MWVADGANFFFRHWRMKSGRQETPVMALTFHTKFHVNTNVTSGRVGKDEKEGGVCKM